jgi:hypothetical protein
MSSPTTEEPRSDTALEPMIAPRLRRKLAEHAQQIVDAEPAPVTTAEKLRAQLAEHEQQIADAERELGTATLDGSDHRRATKTLTAAREDAKRVEAALAELKRREQETWHKAWAAAVSAERLRGYRWFIDYLHLVADYQRKQAVADEAADRLRDVGEVASIRNFQTGLWGLPTETLYDPELLGATSPRPLSRKEERKRMGESPLAHLTVEECERLRKKAELLAVDEEAT